MNWCKPCNVFHGDPDCPRCVKRVVAEAGRLPLRVVAPQAWPRCHRCWNLSPVCRCDGGLGAPEPDPGLATAIG